jgi:hypothetical protein
MAKPCRYCQKPVVLLKHGASGYPYARNWGPVWACLPCDAWVGCHPGTEKALGGVANAELRAAKQAAHAAFDPLWRKKILRDKCSKSKARRAGYRWLSEQLGIPYEQTHIGYFDVDQCRRVVEVCTELKRTSSTTNRSYP